MFDEKDGSNESNLGTLWPLGESIVRTGSKPSVQVPSVGRFGLEPSPPCLAGRRPARLFDQNRFLRTLQPTSSTGFLRHILSRKLPFVNPILQCHRPTSLYRTKLEKAETDFQMHPKFRWSTDILHRQSFYREWIRKSLRHLIKEICPGQKRAFLSANMLITKHQKNCKCCPLSLLIVR